MARAFTSADIVQHADGADTLVTSPSLALPSGSAEGSGGLIVMGALNAIASPENWDMPAGAGASAVSGFQVAIMCRADLPAGETTWPFVVVGGGSSYFVWLAEEWSNLAYAPVGADANTNLVTNPASISTGTTGSAEPAFYVAVAAVFMTGGASSGVWPSSVTWSNGFTETDVVSIGSGAGVQSFQLRVARKYETDVSTGTWETTANFGATQTNKTAYACLAVFRAESYPGEA
jgi:hypothetical protein